MDITTTRASEVTATRQSIGRTVRAYITLTKPRVLELLLVTTVPVMILAQNGMPNLWLVLATVIGGAMSAGSAATFNMYIDRDIDAHMHRTENRPLVTGEVSRGRWRRHPPSGCSSPRTGWPRPSASSPSSSTS